LAPCPRRQGAAVVALERGFLERARSSSPFALGDSPVPAGALRELEAAHRALITMHLEKDLKSVRVLRDMFSEGRRS